MYNSMASIIKEPEWRFMNYGYEDIESIGVKPELLIEDEEYRHSIQLYHHLALNIDIRNKRILEIGCGRGGGSAYLSKYCDPLQVTGLDYSTKAINFCRSSYDFKNLDFIVGDAENLPLQDNSFDIVFNVESSHCYSSMENFLGEVSRVLKPGGFLLLTDFREDSHVDMFKNGIHNSGLSIISSFDITKNVYSALDTFNEARVKLISKNVPKPFVGLFKEFAGVKGTTIYQRLGENRIKYLSFVMQKIN